MVSVRRPVGSKNNKPSLFSVKNLLLVFILGQSLNLLRKVTNNGTSKTTVSSILHIQKEEEPHHYDPHEQHSDHDAHAPSIRRNSNVKNDVKEVVHKHDDTDEEELPEPETHHDEVNEEKSAAVEVPDAATQEILSKHGTGPASAGYVVDLLYERTHAAFRKLSVPKVAVRPEVKALAPEAQPCEYRANASDQTQQQCRDGRTLAVAYNSADFPRSFCGVVIEPKKAVELEKNCHFSDSVVHLFPNEQDAPASGKGMPAIVVQSTPGVTTVVPDTQLKEIDHCDIPCKYEMDMPEDSPLYIGGTNWTLIQTIQDPYTSSQAKVERTAFRHDTYYSTTSFKSSVPLSHYSFEQYNLRRVPTLEFDSLQPKATYLLDSHCNNSPIRRQKWYAAVEAALPTASYGSCQHNTDLGPDESLDTAESRIKLMQKNRIVLAFEAGNEKDHITPIVWEALLSGAVPAVLGASNLGNHLPEKSFIQAGNFNNWDKFAEYLKTVVNDKTLWESHHAWRKDETQLKQFDRLYNFTRTSAKCRVCRWAYAKLYGLGWDHQQQAVKENHLRRQLCVNTGSKLAIHPFRETWKGARVNMGSKDETCFDHSEMSDTTIDASGVTIKRSIVHHDGVTDLVLKDLQGLQNADDSVVLRLEMDVQNSEGAYFRDTHTLVRSERNPLVSSASIQDDTSKVTVLASWETNITSPQQGVIEIEIRGNVSGDVDRRIRVIGEDMSELHDKMTEYYPSSFGKMMIFDFVEPLELYHTGSATAES